MINEILMNLDDLKSGMGQLVDWLPDQQEKNKPQQQAADWIGWDGWVNVADQPTESEKRHPPARSMISIRPGSASDLDAVNAVIEACVMTWNIPQRVKRLSMPSYLYTENDLKHLTLFVACESSNKIIGVAALEPAETADLPQVDSGLLLHGIFVQPDVQHSGVGRQLVRKSVEIMRSEQYAGMLVKAQPDAIHFFRKIGFRSLPTRDNHRDYPHRFWLAA